MTFSLNQGVAITNQIILLVAKTCLLWIHYPRRTAGGETCAAGLRRLGLL